MHVRERAGRGRKAIELQPNAEQYHAQLMVIQIQRGNPQAALASAQQEPPGPFKDAAIAAALQIGEDRAAADAALKNVVDKYATVMPYAISGLYALRGEADKTFEWLDRAWTNRDPSVANLLLDPLIQRYKDDPRFAAFCRKVGLPVPGESASTR